MEKKGYTTTDLKIIAIVAMVIDHTAWGFLDFYSWPAQVLHVIGRLTIPIMSFFIAEGFRRTSNLRRYILRMLVFSIIAVVPFYLFFHEEYDYRQNIIFDMMLGLLLLTVLEHKKFSKPVKVVLSILLFLVSAVIGGWPIMPMLYILIFYYMKDQKKRTKWFCLATCALEVFMMVGIALNNQFHFAHYDWIWYEKMYFLGFMLALPLINRYNGEKGEYPLGKYFFYLFYPGHFLVLFGIKLLIQHMTAYTLYTGLQMFSLLMASVLLARLLASKASKAQAASVLFTISGMVYALGFFLETTAKSLDLAYGAVTVEYFGECLVFIGFTIFLSEYCHMYFKRSIYVIESIVSVVVVGLVYTARDNHIFYTSISLDETGSFPRLVLKYGVGFYGFCVYMGVLVVGALYLMIREYVTRSGLERRRIKCVLLAFACPWLAIVIRVMGLTGGYEVSFLGIIAIGFLISKALLKYGYFDSVQQAGENVLYKSSEGLLVLSRKNEILYFNDMILNLFPKVRLYYDVMETDGLVDIIGKEFDETGAWISHEIANTFEQGDCVYELNMEPLLEADYVQGYIVRILDYTEHYHKLEEARKNAHIDALTGLYDREIFKVEITEYLDEGHTGAMFMMDVDFFKSINDNYGHRMGDDALIALAKSLQTVCGQEHLCCRIGGDEFLMFAKGVEDKETLGGYADELNETYKKNIAALNKDMTSSLSIGIALAGTKERDEAQESFEELYQLADKALYDTKEHGKNGYRFYAGVLPSA